MAYLNNFMFCPGGEHESGNNSSQNAEDKKTGSPDPEKKDAGKEHKSIKEKIKDALQDWSNKDEQDFEYDDTKV